MGIKESILTSYSTKFRRVLHKFGRDKILKIFVLNSGHQVLNHFDPLLLNDDELTPLLQILKPQLRNKVFLETNPAESDVLIISGRINKKLAPYFLDIYEQMPEQKQVVAFGADALHPSPFKDGLSSLDVNDLVEIDYYIPGQPPKWEDLGPVLDDICSQRDLFLGEKLGE